MSERETKVDANTTDDVEKGENDLLNEESKSRAKENNDSTLLDKQTKPHNKMIVHLLPGQEPPKLTFQEKYFNIGNVSNMISFTILIIGWILVESVEGSFSKFVLAFGLFGFAGGITNWIAVTMLFDQIPFLYGSGVIPRQFREIRKAIKDTILVMFFDSEYLQKYISERSDFFIEKFNFAEKINKALTNPEVDTILIQKLTQMAEKPEGAVLNMVAGFFPNGVAGLVPLLKPMLAGFGEEMIRLMGKSLAVNEVIDIESIRDELDKLMEEKLKELTADKVKAMIESIIREHLHWLIIWGNVFGGLLGVISQAVGYGIDD